MSSMAPMVCGKNLGNIQRQNNNVREIHLHMRNGFSVIIFPLQQLRKATNDKHIIKINATQWNFILQYLPVVSNRSE